jgi:hypothetical protein
MAHHLSADTMICLAQRTPIALRPVRELADQSERLALDLSAAMRCALEEEELHAATVLGLAAALRGRTLAADLLRQLLPAVDSMSVAACLLKACADEELGGLVVFLSKAQLLLPTFDALLVFIACTRSGPTPALVGRLRRALRRRASPFAAAFAFAAAAHVDDPHVVRLLGRAREEDEELLAKASARMEHAYVHAPWTLLPLEAAPEQPLQAAEDARVDPQQLDSARLIVTFRALQRLGRLDAAEALLSELATRDDTYAAKVDEWREELIDQAISMGRLDMVERQEALFADSVLHDRLRLRIGLAKPDPTVWPFIEARARAGLEGDMEALYDLAFGLLDLSPALGVLVARGCFQRGRVLDNEALYDSLLDARDELGLDPHEPYGELLSAWAATARLARSR